MTLEHYYQSMSSAMNVTKLSYTNLKVKPLFKFAFHICQDEIKSTMFDSGN